MKIKDTKTLERDKRIAQIVMEHASDTWGGSVECLEKDIKALLASQLEEVAERVEKMRRKPKFEPVKTAFAVIYNEAIEDILSYLKGEMK